MRDGLANSCPAGVEPSSALARLLFDDLPVGVAWTGGAQEPSVPLVTPDEVEAISHAVERRRRSFLNGRATLRVAAAELGITLASVGRADDRAPVFPSGVAGSLSHTDGMVIGAAHGSDTPWRVGVDVERTDRDLSGVVDRVLMPDERAAVERGDAPMSEIAVFSAKEALYKAQHQWSASWLGFEDVVARPDGRDIEFTPRTSVARDLPVTWPVRARTTIVAVESGHCVVTAVVVRPAQA